MDRNILSSLETHGPRPPLELKVYRTWISQNLQTLQSTDFCCILLDKVGDAIQTNMDIRDIQYFENIMQIGSANQITRYFCEATYNRLESRIAKKVGDKQIQYPVLTDYIGCIKDADEIETTGSANTIQRIMKKIHVENLNGNVLDIALWGTIAENFDREAWREMEQPVILAISSCRVTKFRDVQLLSTTATHYYFNPDIPEVCNSLPEYRQRYLLQPPLNITRRYPRDNNPPQMTNRLPLDTLLQRSPTSYKVLLQDESNRQYRHCDLRFLCSNLVNIYPDQFQTPPQITASVGKRFTLQFKYSDKGKPTEFLVNKVLARQSTDPQEAATSTAAPTTPPQRAQAAPSHDPNETPTSEITSQPPPEPENETTPNTTTSSSPQPPLTETDASDTTTPEATPTTHVKRSLFQGTTSAEKKPREE